MELKDGDWIISRWNVKCYIDKVYKDNEELKCKPLLEEDTGEPEIKSLKKNWKKIKNEDINDINISIEELKKYAKRKLTKKEISKLIALLI